MEAEVTAKIGADKYESIEKINNQRNYFRIIQYNTRLGAIDLKIPEIREGTYSPSFPEPRLMWKKALVNVVQEAYVNGISIRKVDELVQALGMKVLIKVRY